MPSMTRPQAIIQTLASARSCPRPFWWRYCSSAGAHDVVVRLDSPPGAAETANAAPRIVISAPGTPNSAARPKVIIIGDGTPAVARTEAPQPGDSVEYDIAPAERAVEAFSRAVYDPNEDSAVVVSTDRSVPARTRARTHCTHPCMRAHVHARMHMHDNTRTCAVGAHAQADARTHARICTHAVHVRMHRPECTAQAGQPSSCRAGPHRGDPAGRRVLGVRLCARTHTPKGTTRAVALWQWTPHITMCARPTVGDRPRTHRGLPALPLCERESWQRATLCKRESRSRPDVL